jgi:hypothetical protein
VKNLHRSKPETSVSARSRNLAEDSQPKLFTAVGREEPFEWERGSDPDFQVWNGCALSFDNSNDVDEPEQFRCCS